MTNEYDDDDWVKEEELNERDDLLVEIPEHNQSRSRSRSRQK